jgi:UrcA family protein
MKTLSILAAALSIAGPAATAEYGVPQSGKVDLQVTVDFSDLDLSRTSGADALIVRLRNATRRVCGQRPNADLDAYRRYRECTVQSMDAAVKRIDKPLVTARYAREAARAQLATK